MYSKILAFTAQHLELKAPLINIRDLKQSYRVEYKTLIFITYLKL
jgi:hypothetical protein